MKRLLLLLCVLAMLLTMTCLAGCTDDEKDDPEGDNPPTEENANSDDSVVNKDNTVNDDTAADIFDRDPYVSDNLQ